MEARSWWDIFKVPKKKKCQQEFYTEQKGPSRMMAKQRYFSKVINRIYHQQICTKDNTKEYHLGRRKTNLGEEQWKW